MIYDEYPDQLQLNLMGKRIYDRAKEKEENPGEWLRDLIQVMMYQEVYKRRSDRRKYGKKYFQGINTVSYTHLYRRKLYLKSNV